MNQHTPNCFNTPRNKLYQQAIFLMVTFRGIAEFLGVRAISGCFSVIVLEQKKSENPRPPAVLGSINSHMGFPMVGMVINLIVGVYIPIIRVPY